MPDKLTPEQRHNNMSAIKGKNTKPEILVRSLLHAHGYRFRLHDKRLPGTPDIVMKRLHTVIMVNGCFWHGHRLNLGDEVISYKLLDREPELLDREPLLLVDSECCKIPKSNTEFWVKKIQRNRQRDARDRKLLTSHGWNVITIWECELKPAVRNLTLQRLIYTLSQIELKLAGCRVRPYGLEEEEPVRLVADDGSPSPRGK